jgi:hypothetical protein
VVVAATRCVAAASGKSAADASMASGQAELSWRCAVAPPARRACCRHSPTLAAAVSDEHPDIRAKSCSASGCESTAHAMRALTVPVFSAFQANAAPLRCQPLLGQVAVSYHRTKESTLPPFSWLCQHLIANTSSYNWYTAESPQAPPCCSRCRPGPVSAPCHCRRRRRRHRRQRAPPPGRWPADRRVCPRRTGRQQ